MSVVMNTPTIMLMDIDKMVTPTTACVSSWWFTNMMWFSRGIGCCGDLGTGFIS